MIWRFNKHGKISEQEEERIEKRAEKLVGITFLVLGVYILYESLNKLINREIAEPSLARNDYRCRVNYCDAIPLSCEI